jgi:phospholipid transport system substrate-binding protein
LNETHWDERTDNMNKRSLLKQLVLVALVATGWSTATVAQTPEEAPDALIKRVSNEVLDVIKADKSVRTGDLTKVISLVDARIMPNVNFQRMTAAAVGPAWRQATPEQQKLLQDEFKILLVRTYAGALAEVTDQTIAVKPLRAGADDKEVVVRTEIRGRGEPIQLDYRMEKPAVAGGTWRIYNLNVLGVWLVENYRSQFAQQINSKGIDGLIAVLTERNKSNSKKG